MGIHTGIILLNIFIICVVSIVIVKIYYRKHADADVDIHLFGSYSFFTNRTNKDTDKIISENEKIFSQADRTRSYANVQPYFNMQNNRNNINNNPKIDPHKPNPYEMKNNNYNPYNTQIIKEGDNMSHNDTQNVDVGKIKEKNISEQINNTEENNIITTDQSIKEETYSEIENTEPQNKDQDLKDLFTIDELIQETKRKITHTTSSTSPTSTQTESTNEIPQFLTPEEREEIKDHVDEMEKELTEKAEKTAESKEDITINKVTNEYIYTQSPINSPILKTPKKTEPSIDDITAETDNETEDYLPQNDDQTTEIDITETEPEIEETELNIEDAINEDEEEYDQLDYRKDIARITNKVKGSKIFQDVKKKLQVEEVEEEDPIDEEFLRNVRSYEKDDAEVIIPESEYYKMESPYIEPEPPKTKKEIAKKLHITPPKKEVLDLKINNNPAKLKKGDEIIFKYSGETYSSNVLKINGDDIYVKFRGKYITIKPSDVKKIF